MLRVIKKVKVKNPQELYNKYNITDKEVEKFKEIIEDRGVEYALALFVDTYMIKPSEEYNIIMTEFLNIADEGELSVEDKEKVEKNISLTTFALSNILLYNFGRFVKDIYSGSVFAENRINTKKVQKAILDATLGQFELLTAKSLTTTQTEVLKNIRNMQKEMIIFNQGKGKFLKGKAFDNAVKTFREDLIKRHPEYYKLTEGKLVSTRPYGPKNTVRHYALQDYVEMSTRTTLLNIDRTAVQINVINKEDRRTRKKGHPVKVVSYHQIDFRPLKTGIEREICKDILRDKKKYGIPLLALDQETADILGIRTVDEVVALGATSVYCRHGFKSISLSLRRKLEKIIKESKNG